MPSEVKQRKKPQKQTDEASESVNGKDEAQKTQPKSAENAKKTSAAPDFRSVMCLLSLAACGALSWMVLQHNERFSHMEEKYRSLQGRTSRLFDMEEEIVRVSKKLAASEDDLRAALSSVSAATRLQQDVAALRVAMAALQTDDGASSGDLQAVNARFLNVTETWQERLAAVAKDLAALKAEARDGRAGAAERVVEAERRAKALAKRLEELEDGMRRNGRAMERAEEDDAKRASQHLDWNTKRIRQLEEQLGVLSRNGGELEAQLQDLVPRAKECEERLPEVEEAVRSILRLGGDLSAADRRLEEVTLQVLGAEDGMLKVLGDVLRVRKELDGLQAQRSVLKMKDELAVVKEAVRELTSVLRGNRAEEEDEEWTGEEEEEEEEWKQEERLEPSRDDVVE